MGKRGWILKYKDKLIIHYWNGIIDRNGEAIER